MEEEKILPEAENSETPHTEEKPKSMLQIQKESWYDKVPLNKKQLDIIVGVSLALLVLTFIVIGLDAMDIFNPFGY